MLVKDVRQLGAGGRVRPLQVGLGPAFALTTVLAAHSDLAVALLLDLALTALVNIYIVKQLGVAQI